MDDGDIDLEESVPRDFPTLRALIAARAPGLPRRLTQVATFALDNPDDIAFGTAASVAQRSGVQPSTLVRFSQALGYQGFSDLQDVFRARLRDRVPSYEERLKQLREHGEASKTGLLLQGFSEAAERSVQDLRVKLDPATLDAAVEILARRRDHLPRRAQALVPHHQLHGLRHGQARGAQPPGRRHCRARRRADRLHLAARRCAGDQLHPLCQRDGEPRPRRQGPSRHGWCRSPTRSSHPSRGIADAWLEIAEADFEGFRSMAATMALAMTLTVAVASKRGAR
jgi:DNA-binding MurR/RpiR family transcriptional regulator